MSNGRGWLNGAVPLVFLVCSETGAVSVQDIRSAWEERQATTRSIRLVWRQVELIPKHSISTLEDGREILQPPDDVSVAQSVYLALSNMKMSYRFEGQIYNEHKGGVRDKSYVSVFNGAVAKNYHGLVGGDQEDFPMSGFIRAETLHYDFDNRQLSPALLYCRPLHAKSGGVDLSAFKVLNAAEVVGDLACVKLEPRQPSEGKPSLTLWLDDEHFLVRKLSYGRYGLPPFYTIDITYSKELANRDLFVPAAWRMVVTNGSVDRVFHQLEATVSSVDLEAQLADDEFEFDFPEGTAVVDNRTGVRMIARKLDDRIVTDGELRSGRATYPALLKTESGELAQFEPTPNRVTRVALGSLILLVGVGVYAFYRRKK